MTFGLALSHPHRRRGLGGAVQFVLDQYSGAAAAFGLNRLRSDFDDAVLRVRREFPTITGNTVIGSNTITNVSSTANCQNGMRINGAGIPENSLINSFTASTITLNGAATTPGIGSTFTLGNEEQDIGLTSGHELDTMSILSFVNAGTAAVVTYYDQSGNNRDVVQAVAANQPRIVVDGSLITSGGKPALQFKPTVAASTNRFLKATLSVPLTQPLHCFAVSQLTGIPGDVQAILIDGANIDERITFGVTPTPTKFVTFAGDGTLDGRDADTNHNVLSALFDGAGSDLYLNGELDATGDPGPDSTSVLTLGAAFNGSLGWVGTASTFLVYPDDQSASRAAIEQSLANYHGITLS